MIANYPPLIASRLSFNVSRQKEGALATVIAIGNTVNWQHSFCYGGLARWTRQCTRQPYSPPHGGRFDRPDCPSTIKRLPSGQSPGQLASPMRQVRSALASCLAAQPFRLVAPSGSRFRTRALPFLSTAGRGQSAAHSVVALRAPSSACVLPLSDVVLRPECLLCSNLPLIAPTPELPNSQVCTLGGRRAS